MSQLARTALAGVLNRVTRELAAASAGTDRTLRPGSPCLAVRAPILRMLLGSTRWKVRSRPLHQVILVLVLLSVCVCQAGAREYRATGPVVRLTPSCAAPDSSILVETNFWPREKHDRVQYDMWWDWPTNPGYYFYAVFSPYTVQRSDTITVPSNATPGWHSIGIEQWEFTPPPSPHWDITGCVVARIEVSTAGGANPWRDSILVASGGDFDSVLVKFDPSGVCGIPRCDRIDLVQVIHATGRDSAGNVRNLSYAEQHFSDGAKKDLERTAAGWRVDVPARAKNPFYTQPGATLTGQPGRSGDTLKAAYLVDSPRRNPGYFPTGIDTVHLDFEICAVCSQGDGKGAQLGRYLWHWEMSRDMTVTHTLIGGSRSGPSQEYGEALELWKSRHPKFKLPVARYPLVGGQPCPR